MIIPEPVRKRRSKPAQQISPLANISALAHNKSAHQSANKEQSLSLLPPKNSLERIPLCSSAPYSPKLDNVEETKSASKSVRFDVSIPAKEEPPALPQRGIPVTRSNPPIPVGTDTSVAGSDSSGSNGKESEVTISTNGSSSSSGEDHQNKEISAYDPHNSSQAGLLESAANSELTPVTLESESTC